MRYLSLFTGIGGFELGIQQAYENQVSIWDESKKGNEKSGAPVQSAHSTIPSTRPIGDSGSIIKRRDTGTVLDSPICIGYSEIDKYAISIYQRHFPNHKNYGDITLIDPATLPDFDFLCGGVPCQSWSIAGKRGGFEDPRGNMWFESIKILRAKRPKYFLFENVKGLLSHDRGKSMERICEELCESGYAIDFDVLNSKNFGVPQNRERVFIFGVRLDLLDGCQVF